MKKLLVMLLIMSMLGSMIIPIQAANETVFDENNIILRFGVTSDIHQNGYYAKGMDRAQVQEWAHTIDTLQRMAGTNEDGSTKLDALLINGDLVDGIANNGSNVGSFKTYGTKAVQNFTEASHVAQGLWGENGGGFGPGMQDGVKLFYSLGNHDEDGRGYSKSYTKTFDGKETTTTPVYSADFIAAVNCGWQYNPNSEEALANTWDGAGQYDDGFDTSYRDYIADLIDYNTNDATAVTADAFVAKYGVALADADAKYDKFYGHLDKETAMTNADGLRVGNSHMTIDPNPDNGTDADRIHFIAVELSQTAASVAWAKEILDKSVEEDPTKPIFVITHFKMPISMFGTGTTLESLHNVIKDYPQVIIWGGHSHTTMHNDGAINSDGGYVAVESASTRYLTSSSVLTRAAAFGKATSADPEYPKTPFNHPESQVGHFGNACYVEVDKNFNVRINRVDLYRSYSKDYEDTAFYQADAYKNFATVSNNDSFEPVDAPVFIREPWDIVDIDAEGSHLAALSTTKRKAATQAPAFPEDVDPLSASCEDGVITANIKLNATDDGMVHMYVVELLDGETVADRKYYTNFYYDFPQSDETRAGDQIAELEYDVTFEDLMPSTDYTVKYYAVDDFGVASAAVTEQVSTPEGILNNYTLDLASSGNINKKSPDAVDTDYHWHIGHTDSGDAAFFQYDLSDIGENEEVISSEWRGFVIKKYDKWLKFVQYDTETKLSSSATYNSIVQSQDYLNSKSTIFDGLVEEAKDYDTATTTDYGEQSRFKFDMTEAVQKAVSGGNKYFTFIGEGTNKYSTIQFSKAYKPAPQLIITTRALPLIEVTNPAAGSMSKQENTAFDISANVTAGSSAISKVDIKVTDGDGKTVECAEPTVTDNSYKWTFANGLPAGTYTAVITATDTMGYQDETSVTIRIIGCHTETIGMTYSYNKYQTQYNFAFRNDPTYLQYDLSGIPDNAIIASATWHFGYSESLYNGDAVAYLRDNAAKLVFKKLITTDKIGDTPFIRYYGSGAVASPDSTKLATESTAFLTSGVLKDINFKATKKTQSGNTTIKDCAGYFAEVDMTQTVKTAVESGANYFGFSVTKSGGSNAMVSSGSGYYRPMLEISYYLPVDNHSLTVESGAATAGVVVNEGDAVLIIAAYNGGELVGAVVEDEKDAAGNITATLTNTDEGTTFKSFVWKDFSSMDPLSALNQ